MQLLLDPVRKGIAEVYPRSGVAALREQGMHRDAGWLRSAGEDDVIRMGWGP